ncbi:AAA family ATPase [Promethearchaeum syntrophicum]|uniref:AAA family ATPase n=1 Tax=Promethearchaeum syntrophicum TaxID=2594042 RepID=A0A5B9D9V0_9ARCH|nr:AAA family ATPase [Candidatus Prometheoarchaeum syntrophicum]QEE15376.1 DNA repair and recombination protein RadB [Candidatus Prometheoarchaeum syntrophicum]
MNDEIRDYHDFKKNSKEIISFLNWSDFVPKFFQNPSISMIWGDVGVGKSTFATQLSHEILKQKADLKIFYLYTKFSPIDQLLRRILEDNLDFSDSNFLLWHSPSFYRQKEIVLEWSLQIQQLFESFKQNKVGLIIVDEIASLYLLELGKDLKNTRMNQDLVLILATLKKIQTEYHIPVVLLNTFSVKQNEKQISQVIPHGGKIIDYWTSFEVKIDRTPQISRMKFFVTKNDSNLPIPKVWSWMLTDKGFK